MRFSRKQIILVAVIAFLCAWTPGTIRLRALQRDVQELSSSVAETRQETASAQAEWASRHQEFIVEEAERKKWSTLATDAEYLAAKAAPESQWALPPEGEPRWNSSSPYIWLRKEALDGLQLASIAFTASGEVTERMAAILALDETQRSQLNDNLTTTLRDFRAKEAANVKPLATLPPEIANLPGAKIGIEVDHLLEASLRFQELYLSTLEASLGKQRAEFISAITKDRLTPRFKLAAGLSTTIAVTRNPDGSFNVFVRSGGNSTQNSGVRSLSPQLPSYLLPHFAILNGGNPDIGEAP